MIKTYTSCVFKRNKLYLRGLTENGERAYEVVDYHPTVWVERSHNLNEWRESIVKVNNTDWKLITDSRPLTAVTFDSIKSAKDFIGKNKRFGIGEDGGREIIEQSVYTSPDNVFISQYLGERFKDQPEPKVKNLKVYTYDIETEVGHRDVSSLARVKIRKTIKEDTFGGKGEEKVIEKTVTIAKFESFTDRNDWVLYDKETDRWVPYTEHPYRWKGGFPEPSKANEKIVLITVKDVNANHFYTWGYNDFEPDQDNVTYFKCFSEKHLLESFLQFWSRDYPDIMTGWNIQFDNTYVYNRMKKVLGEKEAKKLSPYGDVTQREVVQENSYNSEPEIYTAFSGNVDLDYLRVYKKFGTYSAHESYRLDAIAEEEIGIKKIPNPTGYGFREFMTGEFDVPETPNPDDHEIRKLGHERTVLRTTGKANTDEYKALDEKIRRLCQQTFVKYNIRDVELVDRLDNKLKLLDVVLGISNIAHENYEDVFSPVKTWDYTIYHYLNEKGFVIPIKPKASKTEKFAGAFVKSPLIGKHEYCESFDLDSLYPHILMEFNISPEKILRNADGSLVRVNTTVDDMINRQVEFPFLKEYNITMTGSGYCFKRDFQGFMPALAEHYYAERKRVKKSMLKHQALLEDVHREMKKRGMTVAEH